MGQGLVCPERGSEPTQQGRPGDVYKLFNRPCVESVVPGEPTVRNSTDLRLPCHHSVSLRSAMVTAFTPWQLAETTNQGSSTPPESWFVSTFRRTAAFVSRKRKAQITGFPFRVFAFLRKRNSWGRQTPDHRAALSVSWRCAQRTCPLPACMITQP